MSQIISATTGGQQIGCGDASGAPLDGSGQEEDGDLPDPPEIVDGTDDAADVE